MTAKTENSRGSGNPQIKINNESKENIASDCFRERKAKIREIVEKGLAAADGSILSSGLKEFSSNFWRFDPILNKILNSNLSNSSITSTRRSNVTFLRRVDVIFPNSKFRNK